MNKVLILSLGIFLIASCAKKQDDTGAQFSVSAVSGIKATENGTPLGNITRDDANSGPNYKIDGDLGPISFFDKKLTCGPAIYKARRTSKNEPSFSTFKVSDAEFPGFNQLPMRCQCTLSVISVNGAGSTVTKNSPIEIRFDSNPSIKVYRELIAEGDIPVTQPGPQTTGTGSSTVVTPSSVKPSIPLDYYELTNTFSYPVPILFRPNRSAHGYPFFGGLSWASEIEFLANDVQIEPASMERSLAGDGGYRFKIPPGGTAIIKTFAALSGTCPGVTPPILLRVMYGREQVESLNQALGFEFADDDLQPHRAFGIKNYSELPFKIMNYMTHGVPKPAIAFGCTVTSGF